MMATIQPNHLRPITLSLAKWTFCSLSQCWRRLGNNMRFGLNKRVLQSFENRKERNILWNRRDVARGYRKSSFMARMRCIYRGIFGACSLSLISVFRRSKQKAVANKAGCWWLLSVSSVSATNHSRMSWVARACKYRISLSARIKDRYRRRRSFDDTSSHRTAPNSLLCSGCLGR